MTSERAVVHVGARGTVETGRRVTWVDAVLTIGSRVARGTFAVVRVNLINACPSVQARTGGAVVVVGLTVNPAETRRTLARV